MFKYTVLILIKIMEKDCGAIQCEIFVFDLVSQTSWTNGNLIERRRRGYLRFEGSSIERPHQSCVLKRKGKRQGSIRDGERERETEAEGVGVKTLRDTTPVASTWLPKEPPFGNRAFTSTESTCRPLFASRRSKLMKNEAWKRL